HKRRLPGEGVLDVQGFIKAVQATGLVGDPSGKTEARRMLTRDEIDANAAGIAGQIASVVRFGDDETGAELVNNADWLADLTWIEVLRDVGSRVSVNR
ncbi:hypothetical protein SB781_33430, partial [Paraburkholderia sp. SIMBA_061]